MSEIGLYAISHLLLAFWFLFPGSRFFRLSSLLFWQLVL